MTDLATPLNYDLGDLFTGPLDLLLYLVRRNEVDITDFPVARITSRFVEMMEVAEFLDIGVAGEFLVSGATLTEIKSRLVLPAPEETEAAEESAVEDDTNDELVATLLAYKQFRDAAVELDQRAAEWRDRYPRMENDRPDVNRDQGADRIRDVELWDLVSALGRILRTREVQAEGHVRFDDTPIHVYVERIGSEIRRTGEGTFSSFFAGETDKHRIVGVFLAILELVRHHGFRAEQPEGQPEIWIRPPEGEEETPVESADPADADGPATGPSAVDAPEG